LVLRCEQQTDIEKWVLSLPPRTEPSKSNPLHAYRYRTELTTEDITNIVIYIDAHLTNPIEMRGFCHETSAGLCYVSETCIKYIYTHRRYFCDTYNIPMFVYEMGRKYLRALAKQREDVLTGKVSIKEAAAKLLIGVDAPLADL
jgi:hypothetical protein